MKSHWLTGSELIADRGIKDFEILQYVKEGLQPYYKGRKGIEPLLPPEVIDIKTSIKILSDEIDRQEKNFDGFRGIPIRLKEWRNLTPESRIQECPGAKYYSDGSTDWIREGYENQKANLAIYKKELATYPDLPSWRNYDKHKDNYNLDSVILRLLTALFKREDIEAIEATSNGDHIGGIKASPKMRPVQKDKGEAIAIAKAHIAECCKKGMPPNIVDGINRVMERLTGDLYVVDTIRNWIKEEYPAESRTPGRKKGWKERKETAKERTAKKDLFKTTIIFISF